LSSRRGVLRVRRGLDDERDRVVGGERLEERTDDRRGRLALIPPGDRVEDDDIVGQLEGNAEIPLLEHAGHVREHHERLGHTARHEHLAVPLGGDHDTVGGVEQRRPVRR
jgi:hypothetical protein